MYPILNAHLKAGSIFIDHATDDYVGIADDGTHVLIGNVGWEDQTENYLHAHPTPNTW